MKKILLIPILACISLIANSQTSLTTILSWFETADKPTQSQFEAAWRNSYNAVTDGMWDLTGYPSISFKPYTTMQVGKFSQIAGFPTDTTTALIYNGTLKVSNLWIGNTKWNEGGGGSGAGWTLSGTNLYPTSEYSNVAIGTTTTSGYKLFVNGSMYSFSVNTPQVALVNSLGYSGYVQIDGLGNLAFQDMYSPQSVTLSSLVGVSAWSKAGYKVYLNGLSDSVSIGRASVDSVFNVYGTSYFQKPAYFDSSIYVSGILTTNRYLRTPSVYYYNGSYSGLTNLDTVGKMTFYDVDFPSGISLSTLSAAAGGYFIKSGNYIKPSSVSDMMIIGGASENSQYNLSVNGNTFTSGIAYVQGGIELSYQSQLKLGNYYITSTPAGLTFNDPYAGSKTLYELAGVNRDSMYVSKLNSDTIYLNGTYNKKIYSPHTKNIFVQIDTAEWKFQNYTLNNLQYGIFKGDIFQFSNLISDTMQNKVGFEERGRMYLSKTDTVPVYATGKSGEWRRLASEDYVLNAVSGGLGSTLSVDTLKFTGNLSHITTNSTNAIRFKVGASATPIALTANSSPQYNTLTGLTTISGLSYLSGLSTLSFTTSGANRTINGFRNDTTFQANDSDMVWTISAIREYVSEHGGTGSGGIGVMDLYPDASPDTFLTANDTTIGYFVTNLFNSSTSFITGYPSTADSVKIGSKLQITNNYSSETALKYSEKLFQSYAGSYLSDYSQVYANYSDADANNGYAYGLYSHLYVDENYASSGNTSYSSAGRFITQNYGTTTIGGGSPGTLYMNGVYGEIAGTINASGTPGTYILAAIYGKNSNAGSATGYAGYFDGNVNVVGTFANTGTFTLGNGTQTGSINTSDWDISSAGALTGISGITNNSLLTSSGGAINLNVSSDYAVNIATGTSVGPIALGGGNCMVSVNSESWDISTLGAITGITTMSMSGQLTNTIATGTSPFVISSTTLNTNLNADMLDGYHYTTFTDASNLTTGTLSSGRGITSGSTSASFVGYNGTTSLNGQFDGGTTTPVSITRLNYGGYFHATSLYAYNRISNSVGGAERVYFDPGVSNSSTAIAHMIDTRYSMTGNARVLQIKNAGTELFYIKNDTSTFVNNLRFRQNLYMWKYRALTDTMALVLYPGGKMDTAKLVYAAKGWDAPLEDFDTYYSKAEKAKALPLPYPDGTERRAPNAMYMSYQFEYELERLTRYFKEERDMNKILTDKIAVLEKRINEIEKE